MRIKHVAFKLLILFDKRSKTQICVLFTTNSDDEKQEILTTEELKQVLFVFLLEKRLKR